MVAKILSTSPTSGKVPCQMQRTACRHASHDACMAGTYMHVAQW